VLNTEMTSLQGAPHAVLRAPQGSELVIVLHGFPDHPPNFEALIQALAHGGYDVVAPWLRGYAPSTREGPFTVDQVAEDVLMLASGLGYERFSLIGHDWGAIATYAVCMRAPHRLKAAVALSVPHPAMFRRGREQLLLSAYIPLLAGPFGARLAELANFTFVDLLWRRWSPGLSLEPARRRALHACLRESWPAPARYYRALFTPGAVAIRKLARGAHIRVPLLYLHGADDGCVAHSTTLGQEIYFRGPFSAELRSGAGHFLALEDSAWVADRALAWFGRQP